MLSSPVAEATKADEDRNPRKEIVQSNEHGDSIKESDKEQEEGGFSNFTCEMLIIHE